MLPTTQTNFLQNHAKQSGYNRYQWTMGWQMARAPTMDQQAVITYNHLINTSPQNAIMSSESGSPDSMM